MSVLAYILRVEYAIGVYTPLGGCRSGNTLSRALFSSAVVAVFQSGAYYHSICGFTHLNVLSFADMCVPCPCIVDYSAFGKHELVSGAALTSRTL